MAVGIDISKAILDAQAGNTARDLEASFRRIDDIQVFLAGTLDATLTAAPYNYTAGEVATLKSTYSDLAQLAAIYRGTATLAVAKDFRTFAKQIRGLIIA